MSSKAELLRKVLHRPGVLVITILRTSIWWASVDTLAQAAAPAALNMNARPSLWSLEGAASNMAPYLVIGMAESVKPPSYGSLRILRDEVAIPYPRDAILPPVGPVTSVDRAEKEESGPLLLSSLFAPTAGGYGPTYFRAGPRNLRQTIRRSPDTAGARTYTLLDDSSASESFLYEHQANNFPWRQWLADNESSPQKIAQTNRPLLQFQSGGWRFPVMLSGAAASR